MAQISLNLTDYDVTPIHVAYEEALKDSKELNVAIMGSEMVGLVPLRALLQAADFYIKRDNLMILQEEDKVRLAIDRLGLSALHPFHPKYKQSFFLLSFFLKRLTNFLLKRKDHRVPIGFVQRGSSCPPHGG